MTSVYLHGEEATPKPLITTDDITVRSRNLPYDTYETDTFVTHYGTELCITRFDTPVRVYSHPLKKTRLNVSYPFATRRKDNIKRAKTKMKRLVIQNFPDRQQAYSNPHFLTLTYKDTDYAKITNRDKHIDDFQVFMRKLRSMAKENRAVFPACPSGEIAYIATLELTKKGNVHIHAVLFNLPYYRSKLDILNLWTQIVPTSTINNQQLDRVPWGRKSAKRNAEKMARYLSKYLAKAFEDNNMPDDKLYLPSKNLKQPVLYKVPAEVSALFEEIFVRCYRKTFVSKPFVIAHLGVEAHTEIWELT